MKGAEERRGRGAEEAGLDRGLHRLTNGSFKDPVSQPWGAAFVQTWSSLGPFDSCCPHLENGSSKISFKGSYEMKIMHINTANQAQLIPVSSRPPSLSPSLTQTPQKKVRQQKQTLLTKYLGLHQQSNISFCLIPAIALLFYMNDSTSQLHETHS